MIEVDFVEEATFPVKLRFNLIEQHLTIKAAIELRGKLDSLIAQTEPVAEVPCSAGLCCVPIREEIHCGLEAIYHKIGMEVNPGEQRDKLFMAANILNDFLRRKTA